MKTKFFVWIMLTVAGLLMPLSVYPSDGSEHSPCIHFDGEVFDFGVIDDNASRSHSFIMTNTGSAPLVIMNVYSDCGCTAAEYPRDPVMPGDTGRIVVTFNPSGRSPGYFTKLVRIRSNASSKPHRLYIKGKIRK